MITRAPINKEVENLIYKASTYSNENGETPSVDTCISPQEIIDGKWKISDKFDADTQKKIDGQIYMFKLHGDHIYILET